ncbi:MAG: AEC family transporter [Planctomycetota bacterium]
MHIITTISPVIVMILLGYLLRKKNFFSEHTVKELSSLVYWVGLPCLLFYKISTSSFNLAVCGRIYIVLLTALLSCILAAYVTTKIFAIPKESVSAIVQGSFRANLAFIGLPVLMYSFSDAPAEIAESVQVIAVFVLALMVLTHNSTAVIIFLMHQHTISRKAIGKIFLPIITNPLLISSAAGLLVGHFTEQMPDIMERTLSGFSQMVLPLALISVGATIANQKITHYLLPAVLASVIKLGVCPIIGFLMARYVIGLNEEHMRLVMIFLACPTAATSYILADKLGGDGQLTAAIVVTCTILSIVSLGIAVGLF